MPISNFASWESARLLEGVNFLRPVLQTAAAFLPLEALTTSPVYVIVIQSTRTVIRYVVFGAERPFERGGARPVGSRVLASADQCERFRAAQGPRSCRDRRIGAPDRRDSCEGLGAVRGLGGEASAQD